MRTNWLANWVFRISPSQRLTLFIFAVVALLTYLLQDNILRDHLRYGFRDGDWMIIRNFKQLGPVSLGHLANAWKLLGVYTYQVYYLGILEAIFGINFYAINQATHFFKFLGTLSIFPLALKLTNRRMVAFLATIIFAVAYPSTGVLYHAVIGGYHITFISFSIFLMLYYYIVKNNKLHPYWLALLGISFTTTLLLNTERMYPLFPLVAVAETLIWINAGFKASALVNSVKRVIFCFMPFTLIYLSYPSVFKSQMGAFHARWEHLFDGNWQFALYPLTSLGSMFMPNFYVNYLGGIDIHSLQGFLSAYISGQFITLSFLTLFFGAVASMKPVKFTLRTMAITLGLALTAFFIANRWLYLDQKIRIHFDENLIMPFALVGIYILSLSISFFVEWIKTGKSNPLFFIVSVPPAVSFLFILATWGSSDLTLIFTGPHRYLAAPSIGTSLLIAGLITIIYDRLHSIAITRTISLMVLLVLIPYAQINARVTKEFFYDELYNVGMDGSEQTRMKGEFWSSVPDIDKKDPSLFYFDESKAGKYGYFNETTVLAGFEEWIMFDNQKVFVNIPLPGLMRSNLSCPSTTHESCIDMLKEGIITKDGAPGIIYRNTFYKLKNFYAMRFIDKTVINIREEVIKSLGIID